MKDQHLLTLRELAQSFRRFGLSMAWLRREAEAGRIPSLKIGNRILFDRDAVKEALIKRAQKAAASKGGGDEYDNLQSPQTFKLPGSGRTPRSIGSNHMDAG